jgi:hypothetical protein
VSATEKSGFDLSFAVSTGSPLLTDLLPAGYFDPPTRVILVATMAGTATVLMDGVITFQEMVPSDEPGKSVLSIKGDDLTRMLDLVDLTGFPWPAMPAEARVAIAVAKYAPLYGIVPLVMPSVLIDVPNPLKQIPAQQGTDLTYIKALAADVGYVFFIQPGPLPGRNLAYWGPMLRTAIPFLPAPPPIAIDWDGSSNVESLQFSFDGFKKTQFVVLIKVDDVPVPLPIPVPDVTPLSPPLGQKDPVPLKVTPLVGLSGYTPIEAAVIALAKTADAANVITGQGTLDVLRYGSILPARTIVQVQGAGITYDGEYFVSSVTDTIKPGSYKQSFTLQRNRLIAGGAPDPASYGLGQQLPAFSSAAGQAAGAPPLPSLGPPLPVPAPAGPPVPATAGASATSSLPASPAS